MFANDELMKIVEEVDVLIAEIREMRSEGPHFQILHRFRTPGADCAPGEEIVGVYLVHHGREFFVRLSLSLRLLFDYLARHSRLPQSATQIEAGIRADRIYTRHPATAMWNKNVTRSIPRSFVRVYVQRMRSALADCFHDAALPMDASNVLLSQESAMNEVGYP
jgi:hypothetical protein